MNYRKYITRKAFEVKPEMEFPDGSKAMNYPEEKLSGNNQIVDDAFAALLPVLKKHNMRFEGGSLVGNNLIMYNIRQSLEKLKDWDHG